MILLYEARKIVNSYDMAYIFDIIDTICSIFWSVRYLEYITMYLNNRDQNFCLSSAIK